MSTVEASPVTTLARSDLARALRLANSVKAKAVHLDLGDEPNLTAHGPDVGVRVALDAPPGRGTVEVNRKELAALLACCDAQVLASVDDAGRLVVQSGPATYSLPGARDLDAKRYDLTGEPKAATVIEAPVLCEALRRALPSLSGDYTRPILCHAALYPKRHMIVSTNSYWLSIVRYGDDDGSDTPPMLIAREAATSVQRALAKKLGQVELWETPEAVHVRFGDIRWSTRRQGGEFPNYVPLIPDPPGETVMKVDRTDLLAAARAALLVGTRNDALRLTLGPACTATAGSHDEYPQMSRALESASVEGSALDPIGVNPQYVADACASAPVERLTLRFIAPLRPMLIEAARDTYLIMPIRLNV